MDKKFMEIPVVKKIAAAEEAAWVNPGLRPYGEVSLEVTMEDIEDAEDRLARFAPFIVKCFPETADRGGLIESALTPVPKMQAYLESISR